VRSAIVLAGGRSTRFEGDKLLASIDGGSLLDRAIGAVAAVADEVIVAGREVITSSPAVRGIADIEPFGGPLLALRGALHEARGTSAVVVGGDMPDLVAEVLRLLFDRLEGDESIQAVILGRQDPGATGPDRPRQVLPIALFVRAAEAAAEAATADGRRSLHGLLDRMTWAELPPSAWLPLDPDARTLLDVDTRADLERIRAGKGR
jgi:molybdopterin-guanine dinucleotide biosynthesis protein A